MRGPRPGRMQSAGVVARCECGPASKSMKREWRHTPWPGGAAARTRKKGQKKRKDRERVWDACRHCNEQQEERARARAGGPSRASTQRARKTTIMTKTAGKASGLMAAATQRVRRGRSHITPAWQLRGGPWRPRQALAPHPQRLVRECCATRLPPQGSPSPRKRRRTEQGQNNRRCR